MGLLGIEERVSHLGGTFAVDRSPGRAPRARRAAPGEPVPRSAQAVHEDRFAFCWPTITRWCAKGLRLLLESQPGFQVVAEASDGREAVALAEEHTPDVVVLDVAMPHAERHRGGPPDLRQAAADRHRLPEHAFRRRLRAEGPEGGRAGPIC